MRGSPGSARVADAPMRRGSVKASPTVPKSIRYFVDGSITSAFNSQLVLIIPRDDNIQKCMINHTSLDAFIITLRIPTRSPLRG